MENRRLLEGIVVAMVMPFNDDESLDKEGLRALVHFLVERGVHGLFPAGSQGEFYALAADERRHVLDITLKTAEGRAFVFAGIKDSSGDLTQFAEYIRLCGPGFRALMGRDSLILAGLAHGAAGAVAASANVVPELAVSIYDAIEARDFARGKLEGWEELSDATDQNIGWPSGGYGRSG